MNRFPNETGLIHTLPLLLIVAVIGVISFLMIIATVPFKSNLFNLQFQKPSSYAASNLPDLPAKWPFLTLQIGMGNESGDIASMTKTANFGFRYHYLTGGKDTCQYCAWPTWGTSNGTSHTGDYVNSYIQESVTGNITPVFSYYNMLSYSGYSEGDGEVTILNNASAMGGYFNDLKLFYQIAHRFPNNPIVLHFEPDLWGYIESHTTNDDATTIPAQIGSSGLTELAGLPNNVAGFAQAIIKLRDLYAPNVVVAFHMSNWGTGLDYRYGSPTDAQITAAAQKSGRFFNSLNTNYDILSGDPSDRDAGFYEITQSNPNIYFSDSDYHDDILWISTVSQATGKRFFEWQIPYGNQQMRAENNTNNHYQDNHVEKLFGDPSHNLLNQYINAGVVAFLFGGGAGGQSNPTDSGDGVTNPAAITYHGVTNNISSALGSAGTSPSLSSNGLTLTTPDAANDDGGYFRWRAYQYYLTGALTLPSTFVPSPTSNPTSAPSPSRTPTPVPTPTPGTCPKGPNGDANCDGAIDIFDYSAVITHFNQSGTNIAGDVNKDGIVDIFDYSLVVTHFGQ